MPKPQNIKELRDQLLDVFESVKADPKQIERASAMTKTAGVVIAGLKCELEYASLRRDSAHIDFLHYPTRDKLTIQNPVLGSHRLLKEIHSEIDPELAGEK